MYLKKPKENHYFGGGPGRFYGPSVGQNRLQNQPEGLLEASWAGPGRVLGGSWRGLGGVLGPPGAVLGRRGGVLGRLGRPQGGPGPPKRKVTGTSGPFLMRFGPGGSLLRILGGNPNIHGKPRQSKTLRKAGAQTAERQGASSA